MKRICRAVVAIGTGVTALALSPEASAGETLFVEKYIAVENCAEIGDGQFCPSDTNRRDNWATKTQYTNPARTNSVKVEFTANQNHCSDMIAHLYFDGDEWGSHVVHPGGTDGGYEIPSDYGLHQVQYQAEGMPGGCNTGSVSAWGGVMRIWALAED